MHLLDSIRPDKAVVIGKYSLEKYRPHVIMLLSILANKTSNSPAQAKKIFQKGCKRLNWQNEKIIEVENWTQKFDIALERLNLLKADEKRKLVMAIADCVMSDKQITIQEHELLRAICASLHIPLPVLA